MNIIIIGAPGSGKDSLSRRIISQFNNYQVITTGSIYRKEAEAGTEFGLKAKEYWSKGCLCPDEMTNNLIVKTISELQNKENLIFNGYPRTLNQAEFLDTITTITLAINLKVDEEVSIKRLFSRDREDDLEDIVRHRFAEYKIRSSSIIEYYSRSNRIHFINTSNSSEQETYEKALEILLTEEK